MRRPAASGCEIACTSRDTARDALVRIGGLNALPSLVGILEDSDAEARRAAADIDLSVPTFWKPAAIAIEQDGI